MSEKKWVVLPENEPHRDGEARRRRARSPGATARPAPAASKFHGRPAPNGGDGEGLLRDWKLLITRVPIPNPLTIEGPETNDLGPFFLGKKTNMIPQRNIVGKMEWAAMRGNSLKGIQAHIKHRSPCPPLPRANDWISQRLLYLITPPPQFITLRALRVGASHLAVAPLLFTPGRSWPGSGPRLHLAVRSFWIWRETRTWW